jgi:hypothetical protein
MFLFLAQAFSDVQTDLDNMDPEAREKIQQLLDRAEELDLPVEMLERKIMEGLAKEKSGLRIAAALESRLNSMIQASSGVKTGKKSFSQALFKVEAESSGSGGEQAGVSQGLNKDGEEKIGKAQEKLDEKGEELLERHRQRLDKALDKKQDRLEKVLEKKQEKLEKALERKQELLEKKLQKKLDAAEKGK